MKQIIILVILLFLNSCTKHQVRVDPPVTPPSPSYQNAHSYAVDTSGKRILRAQFLPNYDPFQKYDQWEFYELPSLTTGYIYKSLADTPWLVPTFLSFEVDYNTPQSAMSQRAHDKNSDYFVYRVNGYWIVNGEKSEIRSHHAVYLKHKTDPLAPDLFNYAVVSGRYQKKTPRMYGVVDKHKKQIVFEAYFIRFINGTVRGKWQTEELLKYGYKKPGDVELHKKIDNVVFQYYDM